MKKRVLIVDNDRDYLETWVKILERAGYQVIGAESAEQAEKILADTFVHLMMIDVRLRNDRDTRDTSGLSLAKKHAYRYLPKIILTRYPTYDQVRKALGRAVEGLPPAVDFVDKNEGTKAILEAVAKAFENYVRVNRELEIKFDERSRLSFHHLIDLIEPDLDHSISTSWAEELESVFRELFFEKRLIRVDRVCWRSQGRVALHVMAFAEGQPQASALVICGLEPRVVEDAKRASDFAANTASLQRTQLKKSVCATHLAANSHILAGAELENAVSLAELYRNGSEKSFNRVIESLFQETLAPCFHEKYLPKDWAEDRAEDWDSLGALCRARFGLGDLIDAPEEFEKRMRVIAAKAPLLDVKIELASGKLRFHFGSQPPTSFYPDPLEMLRRNHGFPVLINAPVITSGESILTDGSGKAWLTDFANAGPTPLFWDLAALEALIRFDWVEAAKPQRLHELEKRLVGNFTMIETNGLEQSLRSPARAIQAVRKLAHGVIDQDHTTYHWGLLFQAMQRIASFNPDLPLTKNESKRLLHLLIAAAVISDQLSQPMTCHKSSAGGILIDREKRIVTVRGQSFRLQGLSYELLSYLSERPGESHATREIFEQVFQETYRDDPQQTNKLYVAIRRLREKIEDDPDNPRFLLNEAGGGYRLVTNPE